MKSAIQADDAMVARALVLAGLDVDSTYEASVTEEDRPIRKSLTLLHWAAANNALECAKVRDATSTAPHPFCRVNGWTFSDLHRLWVPACSATG